AHLSREQAGDRFTGLRLAPGVGPLVFGVRAYELRDQRVPLSAVWPERAVRLLAERVAGAPQPGRVLESAAAERLTERRGDGPRAGSVTGTVADLLGRGWGVAEVARRVGLGERQLHRRCLDAFGYGPKHLARVLRMRRALRLADGDTPLAEVAITAGYADQAHLSREVRALAGVAVTQLLGRRP
ncbi:MAG: helix-turn-helix transcriptional regulator, partial [Streptomyces sp.]